MANSSQVQAYANKLNAEFPPGPDQTGNYVNYGQDYINYMNAHPTANPATIYNQTAQRIRAFIALVNQGGQAIGKSVGAGISKAGQVAAGIGPAVGAAVQQLNPPQNAPAGAHNIWNELVFAFVGVAALAALAEMNERLGRVLVALMTGFVFMWFLMHSETISGWVNKMVPQTKSGA